MSNRILYVTECKSNCTDYLTVRMWNCREKPLPCSNSSDVLFFLTKRYSGLSFVMDVSHT